MSLLLHIETATEICSVSLSENNKLIGLSEELSPNSHSATLTLLIQKTVAEAGKTLQQLDSVVLSAGPGSFTGLRIGAAAAKGLCYALSKPLIAVPTLQAMAAGAAQRINHKDALYCAVINSIKQEVYAGLYDFEGCELIPSCHADNQLSAFQQHFQEKMVYCFGTGAKKLAMPVAAQSELIPDFANSAAHLVSFAHRLFDKKEFVSVEYFEPFYVQGFVPR